MSNNTNGAVNRGTVINTGVALISIIGILYVAYTANGLDEKFSKFVNMWENRIKVSNSINNSTQERLLNIANNQSKVESELLNSSKHRTVITHEVLELQNLTNTLIKQFNATNEEERGKAVQEITDKIDALAEALNVTIEPQTNSTENVSDEEIIALFKELQNK